MPYGTVVGVLAGSGATLLLRQWSPLRNLFRSVGSALRGRGWSASGDACTPEYLELAQRLLPARPYIDSAATPEEGIDRFLKVLLARIERRLQNRDRLIAALGKPHKWDWDRRNLTVTLEGVTIRFGRKQRAYDIFKLFVEKGCRVSIWAWLPEKQRGNIAAANSIHQRLPGLRDLLQRQVGLAILTTSSGAEIEYVLCRSDTREIVQIHPSNVRS